MTNLSRCAAPQCDQKAWHQNYATGQWFCCDHISGNRHHLHCR